jgi:hypothetical protein
MTPQQPGALVGPREVGPTGTDDGSRRGSSRAVRPDLLAAEAGSWLLLVPAGTCLVLLLAALLGWA